MTKNTKTNLLSLITAFITIGILFAFGSAQFISVNAAKNETETVDLRILGTTDLHGQLDSYDYEQGVDYNNGGLARVLDLINKTKAELPGTNTITLDAGDVLFDYSTEYIFSADQEAIQPIYKAMKLVGYDAITLGNHDFDYGYDYILRQLDGSGLRDITVVSNVTDSRTGEYPFLENMMITRNVKTRSGNEVEIKIGIIGHTIPTLTGKTHSYAGILNSEDIIENARVQAEKLKEMGADIIISLSHTGMGPENPELNFKNVAYGLTKIPEIDVIICGHEHNYFPTKDMTSPYYNLSGVDKKTYLVNDKNVVMAGDRGKAIGVVDLELEIRGDFVDIVDRSSEVRMVTEKDTKEDKTIAYMFDEWKEQLLEYSSNVLAELETGSIIHNYFGLLADNAAIQLLNDSKINYALNRITINEKKYIDYPIVAASTYESYGVKSIDDFVNIHDKITESNLTTLQNYNSYLYVYTITGAQLKEWLEWSASAYETVGRKTEWKDSTMSSLMKETGLKSLAQEEWLNDLSNFYVFDGVSYKIDPSKYPRYDFSGNIISSNRRISDVYYQGKEVTDDMELLIATNKITRPTMANKGVDEQVVLKGFVRSQSILSKYIEQLATSGSIMPQVDYNWNVDMPNNYQFIVKVPYYAGTLLEDTPWYEKYLTQKDQYKYYTASYPTSKQDTTPPHLVVSPLINNPTASPFEIVVQAVDDSKIKHLRFLNGDISIDSNSWSVARDITSKGSTVWKNGIYSIYAEDVHGNKVVKKIIIDNFDDNLLPRPVIDKYTNRKGKISGKAEPNTILVIETPNKTYENNIGSNGTFSIALPGQEADTYITVYVKDDKRGLESERVEVRIHRTGPNQPLISPLYNNVNYLTGNARDNITSVVAIIDDVAYVAKDGGRSLFEANKEIFDASLEIVETLVDVSQEGQFFIMLPAQTSKTSIKVYALDHISRNSRVSTITVTGVAPNAPQVNDVSNIEKTITGSVQSGSNVKVDLQIEDNVYSTRTDSSGRFIFTINEQLYAGQSLVVMASDTKGGKVRYSIPVEVIVNDIETYVRANSYSLALYRITNESYNVSGYYDGGGSVNIAIVDSNGYSNIYSVPTDDNDDFYYDLDETLEAGTKIYAMVRFVDGGILQAQSITVSAGIPTMPTLLNDISNTDKIAKVVALKDCEVLLTIGNKKYIATEYYFDEELGQYIYRIPTDRDLSGSVVIVTASNASGTSDPYTSQIVKASPDAPKVNSIYTDTKVIKGSIELLDYIPAIVEGSETEEKTPKEFKNAPSNVAMTQTRVYAQIGKKAYKGTIDNNGDFTINIPQQTEGTAIKLWGTNKAGRGPLIKVVVTKK